MSTEKDTQGGQENSTEDKTLTLTRAFVCPRCTVVYAADEGCSVCDYDGDLDEFEVSGR